MVMHLQKTSIVYIACCALCCFLGTSAAFAVPTLKTTAQPGNAVLDSPYSVVYELSWDGDPAAYSSVPPSLSFDDWGSISGISTTTDVVEGRNVIRHTLSILPNSVGEFTIPETPIAYFSKADLPKPDENGETADYEYPNLLATSLNVSVREPSDYMLNAVVILGLGIVSFTCAFVFYRRNAVRIAQASDYLEMTVPSMIHDAKKHRLDRDYYAFFQGLLRGAGLLRNNSQRSALQKRFEDLAMSAGYKGFVPSDEDMDKAVESLEDAYRHDEAKAS